MNKKSDGLEIFKIETISHWAERNECCDGFEDDLVNLLKIFSKTLSKPSKDGAGGDLKRL